MPGLVHGLLDDGCYRKHRNRLAQRIKRASENVMQSLTRRSLEVFAEPTGGYYLYLKQPPGIDDIEYAKLAARERIFVAPGSIFSVDRRSESAGMRVNIARRGRRGCRRRLGYDPRISDHL
jgi:DNA-binding transcriptional MocR family regulator